MLARVVTRRMDQGSELVREAVGWKPAKPGPGSCLYCCSGHHYIQEQKGLVFTYQFPGLVLSWAAVRSKAPGAARLSCKWIWTPGA